MLDCICRQKHSAARRREMRCGGHTSNTAGTSTTWGASGQYSWSTLRHGTASSRLVAVPVWHHNVVSHWGVETIAYILSYRGIHEVCQNMTGLALQKQLLTFDGAAGPSSMYLSWRLNIARPCSHGCPLQASRKAPGSALGFRVAADKWLILVGEAWPLTSSCVCAGPPGLGVALRPYDCI
jgi:hypothetical protein